MPAKQNTKTKTKKTASKKKTVVKKAVKKAIPIKKKRIVKKKDPQLSSYKPKKNSVEIHYLLLNFAKSLSISK